jgi:predicted PurR-regulated permease PerM
MTIAVLVAVALVFLLKYAQAMFIPLALGVLISYALDPLVARLVRVHIPRPVAAAIVLCGAIGSTGVLLYQLRYQADAIVQQLPESAGRLRRTLERQTPGGTSTLTQVQKAATELEKAASAAATPPPAPSGVTRVQVEPAPVKITDYLVSGSMGLAAALGQFVLVLFLAFFMLASGDLYRRKLVKIAGPSLAQKRVTVQILEQIDRQIESFLLVQLFTSAVVGVASWLAFWTLGLEQAGVWGLVAGVANSIPYFGPVLVTAGIAVVAFLQFGTLQMVIVVAGAAFAITTIEGFLLTPWLTSRAARMNAVAVFVGLLFWGWVWEIWGLLLAVPMLMVLKAVCDHVEDFKSVGELLGE